MRQSSGLWEDLLEKPPGHDVQEMVQYALEALKSVKFEIQRTGTDNLVQEEYSDMWRYLSNCIFEMPRNQKFIDCVIKRNETKK